MSTTRSSRRRKSANLTDDFIPPDVNISLGGVNTRRRHVRKQNENNDINSDTLTNIDFVTPNTKLIRKRKTKSVVKDLKQPKSESKAVLKESNKELQNDSTLENKIDVEVNDLLETKSSVRKTTRSTKKKQPELLEESTIVDTKETSSADKLRNKNKKRKTKKLSRENDSSSEENSKQAQSKKGQLSPVESLDHTTAEHFPVNKLKKETSLDISSESFHSAAGGSLIDSGESPHSGSLCDGRRVSLSQSLNKLSPIQTLTPIKTPITEIFINTTFEKSTERGNKSLNAHAKSNTSDILNATFDKSIEKCESMIKTPTSEIEQVLNTTFEKSAENNKISPNNTYQSKSTLGSPDLLNTSPFLINDSFLQDDNEEDLQTTPKTRTPESTPKKGNKGKSSETTLLLPKTPLRKEGTFTMDSTVRSISPSTVTNKPNGKVLDSEDNISDLDKTPENNHRTMSLPGSTPYHRDTRSKANNSKSNKSLLFNITHSIEKDKSDRRRRSSSAQPKSSIKTRVAFCSPVPNPTKKGSEGINEKIIKSSLKGSNKSFVYKESDEKKSSRKRSITCNNANDSHSKRRCMTQSELNTSVNRLSRPRTPGSQGKRLSPLSHSKNTTPSKRATTPSKAIKTKSVSDSKPKTASESKSKANSESKSKFASETKQLSRSKLPNFAALHKKQFDKMESLNECQERKAKRALHLLNSPKAPTLSKNLFGIIDVKKKQNLTTTTTRDNSYNRFGFKNPPTKVFDSVTTNTSKPVINTRKNADANIFSIPVFESVPKNNTKANIFTITTTAPRPETRPNRNKIFASRVDSGLSQKDKCEQVLTRGRNTESVLAKNKKESRDFIRGVRTNRRFELQMKQRNLNC